MITKPTVLVLGAGASMPFGFPSGEKLMEEICRGLPNHKYIGVISEFIKKRRIDVNITDFIDALFHSGQLSIDAFLEHNPEYIEIGKIAIAAQIKQYEQIGPIFGKSPNWYKYLFGHLNANFDDFSRNNLSIITYNYDRSLEEFLIRSLMNSYKKDREECVKALQSVPIIHLHGSLGDLPGTGDDVVEFNREVDENVLETCLKNINIIHEDIENYSEFTEANRLLKEAQLICFLGFGYNEANLSRLEFDRSGKVLAGTCYEKGKGEAMWLYKYFCGDIILGGEKHTIGDFLSEVPILRQPPASDDIFGKSEWFDYWDCSPLDMWHRNWET